VRLGNSKQLFKTCCWSYSFCNDCM